MLEPTLSFKPRRMIMTEDVSLAGCIIENDQGDILLIHRNTPNRIQWELPGGKIDAGENSETAAIRELQEELGVKVEIIKKIGEKSFVEDGYTMRYHWFQANIIQGESKLQEAKFDQMKYFKWSELFDRPDLSANTKNLVTSYQQKQISLQ
jgi:8-oxo-dGTP diphosphatase